MQALCQFESVTERQWNSALHQLIGRILNSRATFARQFLPGVWCVFAAAVLLAPVNATSAANLAPHTAHYVMKLLSARGGSGIEAVSGDMAIRWEGDCSGWTMSNRAVFDVTYTGGDAVRVTMDASTWEAAAGDRYTFLVRTLFDTKETQRVEGKARLDGGQGIAEFTLPSKKTIKLPAGTMFPTMHTKRVLDAAGDTPEIIRATVFDGFTDGGAQFVNAIVGKKLATGQTAASAFPTLQNQPAWGISLAFFDADKADAEPNSEIRLEIYRNGIAGMIEMDFGDFRLLAELKELESGKPPVCS
tara:strand:+ start:5515 stop:6423 length:909 start_codon:yes stop_codon:yes gene_type:complete